jgi:putative FmdB family regulatory protein
MPIYEYKCEDCGAGMEFMQKAGDAPKKKCPKCGGKLKKRVSASALQFKGSGWYVTDYAKKNTVKAESPHEHKDKPKSDKPASDKKGDSSSSSDKG